MVLAEFLYGSAFILFMIGVGWCLRSHASPSSLLTMAAGLLLDFTVTIAPLLGCHALALDVSGSNHVIIFAIVAGMAVWLLGFLVLALRKRLATAYFENLLIGVQVLWFIDFVAFAYGMHVYPLN